MKFAKWSLAEWPQCRQVTPQSWEADCLHLPSPGAFVWIVRRWWAMPHGRLPHGQNLATPTSLCVIGYVWHGLEEAWSILESGMKGRRVPDVCECLWYKIYIYIYTYIYIGTVWCGFLSHLAHSLNSHPASEKILRASIGICKQTKQTTYCTNEGG